MGVISRNYADKANFCFGVMPPIVKAVEL